jgi:hypothetical protein
MGFLSSLLYLVGCVLLVPAGFYLGQSEHYQLSIILYIIACSSLTIAAFVDIVPAMRRVKTDAEGKDAEMLVIDHEEENGKWLNNLVICIFYVLGGIFFLLGSVLYYPTIAENTLGTWIFRTGSICYTIGSFLSLHNIWNPYFKGKENVKITCTTIMFTLTLVFYIIGSSLYIAGGILSQLDKSGVVDTWIAGAFFFSAGAICGFFENVRRKHIY